ncbi:glycoside hydrolase superfamily [Aspergillus cavernicola]|uniref:beta-glucosidase n=1 Tax=Aspergillus cavernicola TaxID=176166 RepID=A0ABR4IUI1_9EURO
MVDINIEETLQRLSLDDKVALLSGVDFWHTKALPEYGVPSIRLSDGPNGIRGTRFFNSVPAACFPCGTALGATFNQELLQEAGRKMGEEALAKNVHVILGPTINMQRSPLGGRGFESIGEDPFLAGLGAAALVRGIQSTGVQATIKHFVCNEQEHKRNSVQSIVTERALREIYALPFQLVVRDSQPGAFMTAYNGLNGTFCSENRKLMEDILRKEWAWKGLVMSDWCGLYSTVEAVKAGLDLEMPGPPAFRGNLLKFAVTSGKVWPHIIDNRVREVLAFVQRCAASGAKENGPEGTKNTPETAALLRKIGNEGIVLLKNEAVLPLVTHKKTLVIGPNAKVATYSGGGSASLNPYYTVTPYDGIRQKLGSIPAYTIGAYTHKMLPLIGSQMLPRDGKAGMSWKVYNEAPGTASRRPVDELWLTNTEIYLADYTNPRIGDLWYADLEGTLVVEEDGLYDFGLVVCGTAKLFINEELLVDNATQQTLGDAFFGAGTIEVHGRINLQKAERYRVKVEFGSAPTFTLKPNTVMVGSGSLRVGCCQVIDAQQEIQKAVQLAREHEQVIICGGLNADWESESSDRSSMKLPGLLDQLIAEVAAANPKTVVVMQTGTPEEMPWLDTTPAVIQAWYGGNETGNSIADVLFGDYNPSGKLSLSFPKRLQDVPSFLNFRTEAGRTLYGEDIYLGYRYYEFAETEVNFPFGHGLSYTTFAFSDIAIQVTEETVSATFQIHNTGSLRGAEVAQMYIQPVRPAKVKRPIKELKGFSKVELEAGECREVVIQVAEKYAASYFDEERNQWCVEAGDYKVVISDSSAITEGKAVEGCFRVEKTYWWSGI